MLRSSLFVLLAVLAAPANSTFVVPSFQDLMIKTRETRGLMHSMVTTWYFKGPRERIEHLPEASFRSPLPFVASIMQCDLRTQIRLFEHTKTYSSSVSHVDERDPSRPRPRPTKPPTGPDVTVTSDSVDTGERRQIGSYEARRIKTTITVEPSKGVASKPGEAEIDGWYLDLPGLHCRADSAREDRPPVMDWITLVRAGAHDHLIFKNHRPVPRGFKVEETATQRQAGNIIVNKIELLEVSDQPLDEALFEVPSDYVPRDLPERRILRDSPP